MTNALQLNQSTVVAGLGTQSYTISIAGIYTLSFKSFLPYLTAGTPPFSVVPTPAVQTVTFAADTGGNQNNTDFVFYTAGNLIGYYVWFNINSAGTDPALTGLTGIQVAGATGATANTLAAAARAAVAASSAGPYFTVSGATNQLILTDTSPGTSTNVAAGPTPPVGFTYASTAGSYGVPPISGLDVVLLKNTTVLATYGFPSPTQPIMGGSVVTNCVVGDVMSIVLSSLSLADNALNAVKSIVNLFQGEGQ